MCWQLTIEVGDGVGDGDGGRDALAAPGHVLAQQKLREPLLDQLQLCESTASNQQSSVQAELPKARDSEGLPPSPAFPSRTPPPPARRVALSLLSSGGGGGFGTRAGSARTGQGRYGDEP